MYPPKSLEKYSAAFAAYARLDRLPKGVSLFPLNEDGTPEVVRSERYCRMPAGSNTARPCAAVLMATYDLHRHIERVHKIGRSSKERQPYIRHYELPELDAFYRKLMKDEDYDGKEEESDEGFQPVQQAQNSSFGGRKRKRNNPSRAAAPPAVPVDHDDDEVILIKEETRDSTFEDQNVAHSSPHGMHGASPRTPRSQSRAEFARGTNSAAAVENDDRPQDEPMVTEARAFSHFENQGEGGQAEEDEDDLEFQLEEIRIKGAIQHHQVQVQQYEVQIQQQQAEIQQQQTKLQEVQLKRKMASIKRRRERM